MVYFKNEGGKDMIHSEEVFQLIDTQEAIEFLQSLISYNTVNPPGNEKGLAELIHRRFETLNFDTYMEDLGEGRANVIGSFIGNGEKHLVFSGHLDTVPVGEVPWDADPFEGKIIDDKLFGRGTSDMKSGLAAMILAMEYLSKAGIHLGGTVTFVGTAGEEVNAIGAKKVVESGSIKSATAMVVGEPSNNQIYYAHKGALWLKIEFIGKAAHGSMPHEGKSAILAANQFINEFLHYRVPGESNSDLGNATVNIGSIHGGTSTNMVAESCVLTIDIRTVVGQDHNQIVNDIQVIVDKVCKGRKLDFKINILNDLPAVATAKSDPFIVQSITTANELFDGNHEPKTVNYYTDASIYVQHLKVPILLYGPGEPEMAHKVNEYVKLDKYFDAIKFYIALAINYLGTNGSTEIGREVLELSEKIEL